MSEMNENLIDLNYEEKELTNSNNEFQPQLFVCAEIISERKPISSIPNFSSKANSETQTMDENFLEITPDELMQNRVAFIEPTPFTVTQGFFTSYKLYTILSKKINDDSFKDKVNRRFSDFEWLFQTLVSKYPGYIIPELPVKNFLASMNFEKSEFIESRRKDLEDFLMKLLEHKYLRNAEELRAFLIDDEKEFSIMKGKSELKMKGISINFSKELVGFLTIKNNNLLKKQNDEDKDLQNYKVFFNNIKQTAEELAHNVESLLDLKKGDLKSLANFEISSTEIIQNSMFSQEMHIFNEKKLQNLQIFHEETEEKILLPLKVWIKNSMDVIAALKRREILDDEVFSDMMKIEEMRKNNIKTNNKRDIEMDLLQTRLDANQKLLTKSTKTLLNEIIEFKKILEREIITIMKNFNDTHQEFYKKGGFIY